MMVKRKGDQPPRAAGYCRVSTTGQAQDGVSLDAQQARIRAYCEAHGLALVELIVDAGESGKDMDRPGLQRILELAHGRQVEAVVIYKLDRLFRNTQDALNTSQDFDRRGVALCSISEQLDTSTPMGKFFFTITAAFAEMERAMIAERTRAALAHVRKSGRMAGSRVPYGYDLVDGLLVRNADEQRVIELVKAKHAAGLGARRLAALLTGLGIPTKEGASTWHPAQVQRLLTRQEAYL